MAQSLSVVICTWNRSAMLHDTIRSLFACDHPPNVSVQIVVVDNASTDDTAVVLDALEAEYQFTRASESQAGLSHARNCGIDHAIGEWIIFVDDDVLVQPDFLIRYSASISRHERASFSAGAVVPTFDAPASRSVSRLLSEQPWLFSAIDLGSEDRPLTSVQFPFGANMAVKRALTARIRFRPEYGFTHGVLIPGEETQFFEMVRREGGIGYWFGQVRVLHRLPISRTRTSFIASRAFGQGRADAIRVRQQPARRGTGLWNWRELVLGGIALAMSWAIGSDEKLIQLVRVARAYGAISEGLRPTSRVTGA